MDLQPIKDAIGTNVYELTSKTNVPLHKHDSKDEIFYCVKGSGFGVLEGGEQDLTVGEAFIVQAGVMHSLRTETELIVASFLVPIVDNSRN